MAITVTDYQPDDTIAQDCYIYAMEADTAHNDTALWVGNLASSGYKTRTLIGFDWIWTKYANPKSYFLSDITVKLYVEAHQNTASRGILLYSIKRPFTETATWNKYDGVNSWQTAGGTGANDIEEYGTLYQQTQSGWYMPAVGNWQTFRYPLEYFLKCLRGEGHYGMFIRNGVYETDDYFSTRCSSSSSATAAQRPKYSFTYEPYHKIYLVKSGLGQVK